MAIAALAIACAAPVTPPASPSSATVVAPSGTAAANPTPPPHDGRCTLPEWPPEEIVARLFVFVGQRDQRGIADCFARPYLATHPDAPAAWAAAGPVRRFELIRIRSGEDAARVQVTAELVAGVSDWKGLATRQLTLRRDPDRWAVAAIE